MKRLEAGASVFEARKLQGVGGGAPIDRAVHPRTVKVVDRAFAESAREALPSQQGLEASPRIERWVEKYGARSEIEPASAPVAPDTSAVARLADADPPPPLPGQREQ